MAVFYFFAPLGAPAPGAKQISRLNGQLSFLITTKTKKWEVPITDKEGTETASSFETPQGLITYKVAFRQEGNNYWLTLSHAAKPGNPEPGHALYPLTALFSSPNAHMRVLDNEGRALYVSGGGGSSDSTDLRLSTLGAAGAVNVGDPAKIVIDVPVNIQKVIIPFEFKDLPLP